ncbi:MAG: 1-deoxy-D-xylulose-5-phosphate reductoisomerase [Alphaproteobacteria bacterium]|nr:1-deoxy-D-xylulose-5-phosphate reductoisomerase [Rickettsiales bacterium]
MKVEKQTIAVLGSTGSIGRNTVKVITKNRQNFKVIILAANGSNVNLIIEQIQLLEPKYFFIKKTEIINDIKNKIIGSSTKILDFHTLNNIAEQEHINVTVSAISGFDGIAATIQMCKCSKKIAIANKEAIVCAWSIIKKTTTKHKCIVVPIDSEHNSLYQIISATEKIKPKIEDVLITASGGPFLKHNNMDNVTKEMALKHPKWNMGVENTINSATLINKGLEIIEASLLFNLPEHKIKTLIHPEAMVHAAVSWEDGSAMTFLSFPDMQLHIANAIMASKPLNTALKPFNFAEMKNLHFYDVDNHKFPSINLAREVINLGNIAMVAFNSANETAIKGFLNEKIKFIDIYKLVERAVLYFSAKSEIKINSIENLTELHKEVIKFVNVLMLKT